MLQASVVIPTHNRPHFLRDALQSVVTQDGVELDIIVVGDGAGEDTAAVVAEFPSVRYLTQPQSGPNTSRNRAVEKARFNYIALLDDDDLWLPGKMRTQLEILEKNQDAAYIFSDFQILREGHPAKANGLSTWGIPDVMHACHYGSPVAPIPELGLRSRNEVSTAYYRVDLYKPMLQHPYVLPTTAVFRKSYLTPNIRFVDHDYICGDWEFFARLSRSHPAIFMPVETACNRSHEEQGRLTRTSELIQLQRRLEMIDRLWATDERYLSVPDNRSLLMRTRQHYLLSLAKAHLRHGSRADAQEACRQAQASNAHPPLKLLLLKSLAAAPGGIQLMRGLDRAIIMLRSMLHG